MEKSKNSHGIFIIGALFFVFGFVTWLNSLLIPFLKTACQLTHFQSTFVTFAFYISYFVISIPSAMILKKTGYGNGMALGLVVMAIGSALFIPAAMNRNYIVFLVGLFTQGAGLSLLQTASNPYVTILGPEETAARRMSIMGICNKVAGMLGIVILSSVLFGNTANLNATILSTTDASEKAILLQQLSNQIIFPYIIITFTLIALFVFVKSARLPEVTEETDESAGNEKADRRSIFSYPYLWFGIAAIFFYVGAEVLAIDYLPGYGEFCGLPGTIARNLGAFSLVALVVGYLLGIVLVPRFISQRRALIVQLFLAVALTIVALCTEGIVSVVAIICLSFAHAIMWPAIWPLSIHKLGRHTQLASALLVMAIAGGAILPLVYGKLAELFDLKIAYSLLFVSYAYILFFATCGYKIGNHDNSEN
ncbi:MAG: sugar MFS transporter [Bacteroidales bacterium]|nr:sugar MFS transporter [Bacteroidales bacterium]